MPKDDHTIKSHPSKVTDGFSFNDRVKDAKPQGESYVPSPAAGPPATWFWDTQPGIKEDWLPEGLFPELDELRNEHLNHLKGARDAAGYVSEAREGYEAEDAGRMEDIRAGRQPRPVTPISERQDRLNHLEANHLAALMLLEDFYQHAVATFAEMAPVWKARFADARAKHAEAVAVARAALEAAEREGANVEQAEQWVDRTVNPRGGRYIAAPTFGVGFMTEAERKEYMRGNRDDVLAGMAEQDRAEAGVA